MMTPKAIWPLLGLFIFMLLFSEPSKAQEPKLALTPPMGWSSWYPFVDTINEQKIIETADALVRTGLRDAGYSILQLDDGWMAKSRDDSGRQYADPARFPRGMKFLANYLHDRGLKLGIYSSAGATTCAGYPGSYNHEELDAKTYADWGIDYLKYDACGQKGGVRDEVLFTRMSHALKRTGRPIIFNLCIFYSSTTHLWGGAIGHTWRTGEDIVKFIEKNPPVTYANWYQNLQTQVPGKEKYAGPGHWNDPDNLIIGYARNNLQTLEEQKAQFSFWAIVAAPLFLGNDVRNMPDSIRAILSNREVIAVSQDQAGRQGTRLLDTPDYEVWGRLLHNGSRALVIFNKRTEPATIAISWKDLHLPAKLWVRDLWSGRDIGIAKKGYTVPVAPHGVVMLKLASRK